MRVIDLVAVVYNLWLCVMNRFYDKTNNRWDERNNFIKVPGKYDLLAMDYGSEVMCVLCALLGLLWLP